MIVNSPFCAVFTRVLRMLYMCAIQNYVCAFAGKAKYMDVFFIVTAVASVVFPCCFRKNHVLLVRSDRYKF